MPALLDLAALYSARGLLAEARDALEHAAAASPGDARVAEALATVLTDLGTATKCAGRLDQAVELYSAAAAAWPALAAAHYNLVRGGGLASGRPRGVCLRRKRASSPRARKPPHRAHTPTRQGVVASEAGRARWPEALEHYARAVAANPGYAQVRARWMPPRPRSLHRMLRQLAILLHRRPFAPHTSTPSSQHPNAPGSLQCGRHPPGGGAPGGGSGSL